MQVGKLIRSLREERGIRSSDLAKTIGVSRSYVSRIEHEDRRLSTDILLRIAQALSVEPSVLLEAARQDPRDLRLRKALDLSLRGRMLNPRFVSGLFAFLDTTPEDSKVFEPWGEATGACAKRLLRSLEGGGALEDLPHASYSKQRDWVKHHLVEFVEQLEFFESTLDERLFLEDEPKTEEKAAEQHPPAQGIPLLTRGSDLLQDGDPSFLDILGDVAGEKLYAFIVRDNSMSPVYEPGTTVLASFDRAVQAADRVLVCLENGKILVKIFRQKTRWVQLVSQNPIYEPLFLPLEEVRWMHPIVRSIGV